MSSLSIHSSTFTRDAPFSSMGMSFGVDDEAMLPAKTKEIAKSITDINVFKNDPCTASLNVTNVIAQLLG